MAQEPVQWANVELRNLKQSLEELKTAASEAASSGRESAGDGTRDLALETARRKAWADAGTVMMSPFNQEPRAGRGLNVTPAMRRLYDELIRIRDSKDSSEETRANLR